MRIKRMNEFLLLSVSICVKFLPIERCLAMLTQKEHLESVNIEINADKSTFKTKVHVF